MMAILTKTPLSFNPLSWYKWAYRYINKTQFDSVHLMDMIENKRIIFDWGMVEHHKWKRNQASYDMRVISLKRVVKNGDTKLTAKTLEKYL